MAVGEWPKGLVEDRYGYLWETYGEAAGKVDMLFEVKTDSDGMYDQLTKVIGMGKLQQKEAGDTTITFRSPTEGFTAYTAYRQFDDGLRLTRLTVERFPKNKVRDLVKEAINTWGRKLRTTEESFGASLFKNGGKTAGHADFKSVVAGLLSQNADGLAYDAKPYFNRSDNTRTSKGGGTYYNAITGTLSAGVYEQLYELLHDTNAKDERDEEVDVGAGAQLTLVHPTALKAEAFTILKDEVLAGANNEQKNQWFGTAVPVEWRYINSNATTAYLGYAKRGIRFYRASKPEIRMWRDEKNGNYEASIWCLMGWMAHDFRFWTGTNVPTS